MASFKITDLTELASGSVADTDVLEIVDLDANQSKKVTIASLKTVFSGGGVSEGTSYTGGTANGIMFNDGNTFATSTNLVFDGTNLGIGTTPVSRLWVKTTNADTNQTIGFISTNSVATIGGFTDSGSAVKPLQFRAERYQFHTDNGIMISGRGYNLSPSAVLHIQAKNDDVAQRIDLSNGQTADAFQINSYGNTGGDLFRIAPSGQTFAAATVSGTSNDILEYTYTSTSGYDSGRFAFGQSYGRATISLSSGLLNASIGLQGSNLQIGTQNVGSMDFSTRYFRFQTSLSGGYYNFKDNNGDSILYLDNNTKNVGIGTTSPSAKLQVKGSGTTSATTALLVEDSLGTDLLKVTDEGSFYINGSRTFTNSNNNSQLTFNNTFTDDNASNNTYFALVDIDYTWDEKYSMSGAYLNDIRITPNFDGQVSGNQDLSSYVPIYIKPTFGSNLRNVTYKGIYLDTPTFNQINPETYHPLYITSGNSYFGGNVGIGTTSPSAKLHTSLSTDVVANRIDLSNGQTADAFQINSFGNTGGDLFRVLGDGKVSIGGTGNTTRAFMVKDAGGNGFQIAQDTSSPTKGLVMLQDSAAHKIIGYENKPIDFYRGSHAMRISSSQTVSIGKGASDADASSILDLTSTTKGVLLPRMTTTQRDAIASPATGLLIFNTTTKKLDYYSGTAWGQV